VSGPEAPFEPERRVRPGGRRRFDEVQDATRRTRLANERTYLAWWRTGLTAFAVSFGAGKVVPQLTDEPRWPYAVVGAGFAILGILCIGYGFRREIEVERALTEGEFAPIDRRYSLLLSALGVGLGALTLLLVVLR
jgi:putative membrane protein